MVTEPVFASVANVLSGFDGIPSIQSVRLSELEVKNGLTQVRHCCASYRQQITAPAKINNAGLASRPGLTSLQSPSLSCQQANYLLTFCTQWHAQLLS